jgi:hypothetical protein
MAAWRKATALCAFSSGRIRLIAMREASSMQTWTYSQPTCERRPVAALGAVAGDAMSDLVEAAELLDVDMDELAGMLALVASDGLCRVRAPSSC